MPERRLPIVLVPSLEPDDRLPAYVSELMSNGFSRVVVVNDGSSADYQPIFDRIASLGATVLGYEVNHGKGYALKHGYRWILEHEPDCAAVLTADADGQHTVPDCLRMAEALEKDDQALWLGSRDFNLPEIPPKSRFGNKTTSAVFKLLYGVWLPDTQTGLRAFRREELPAMIAVAGDRYEYEMNVLIDCARRKFPIRPLTIETVYENNNEGTHFHPIRDSWRIYRVILGSFFRYAVASIVSFLLDYAVLSALMFWVFKDSAKAYIAPLGIHFSFRALVAAPIARLVSAPVNYLLNRKYVFREKRDGRAVKRYFVLALCSLVITTLLFGFLDHFLSESAPVLHILLKIVIDVTMYFVNYRIQQRWVFSGRKEPDPHA